MELPQIIWDHKLSNGVLLSDFVDRVEPTVLPLNDITAFTNVWRERLADADARDLPDLKNKAQQVLHFLSEHNSSLLMLIWPHYKLAALYEQNSLDILMLD